ncbi:MAG: SDR family NAD(P)-dependent oxidoreductase [Gammaproteobacteria bacterium]|nr:SDR family NAD(P)-dependent oxidoreductase [Gammaproteobacteria bacterium]
MKSLNPKITDWRDRRVWIIGASSGIGAALTHRLAQNGARLAVSARTESALRDLIDGKKHLLLPLDVTDKAGFLAAQTSLLNHWNGVDMIFYCAGTYRPMRTLDMDPEVVEQTLAVNLQGVFNLLHVCTPMLTAAGAGGLCLVASVAGYTGLPKALAYGPSKAALINLAQILYTDLSPKNIGVYLVNPGFVATRLTDQNDFKMPALISPDEAAAEILQGIAKGRFEVHFPRRFTYIMKLVRALPDRLRFAILRQVASS